MRPTKSGIPLYHDGAYFSIRREVRHGHRVRNIVKVEPYSRFAHTYAYDFNIIIWRNILSARWLDWMILNCLMSCFGVLSPLIGCKHKHQREGAAY